MPVSGSVNVKLTITRTVASFLEVKLLDVALSVVHQNDKIDDRLVSPANRHRILFFVPVAVNDLREQVVRHARVVLRLRLRCLGAILRVSDLAFRQPVRDLGVFESI